MIKIHCILLIFLCLSSFTVTRNIQASAPTSNTTQVPIHWVKQPRPAYSNADLKGQNRTITVFIHVSVLGEIESVKIVKSSGLEQLDQIIVNAVKKAKLTPYVEKGPSALSGRTKL